MALPHAQPIEPVDVRPLGDRLGAERSTALFKSEDLEVIRLVLDTGECVPPHQVAGEATLQCLEGRLRVDAQGREQVLQAGQLLYVPGGLPHAITALSPASALLTIALKPIIKPTLKPAATKE